MSAGHAHRIVQKIDEQAYLDGCSPQTAHYVVVDDDDGVETSDGHLYCRRCCWDVRGSPVATTMDSQDDACHCEGCGCLLAYTLSTEAACRQTELLDEDMSRLHCEDRYHLARMLEACPEGTVLKSVIEAMGFDGFPSHPITPT